MDGTLIGERGRFDRIRPIGDRDRTLARGRAQLDIDGRRETGSVVVTTEGNLNSGAGNSIPTAGSGSPQDERAGGMWGQGRRDGADERGLGNSSTACRRNDTSHGLGRFLVLGFVGVGKALEPRLLIASDARKPFAGLHANSSANRNVNLTADVSRDCSRKPSSTFAPDFKRGGPSSGE